MRLPVGLSDFEQIIENEFDLVDKSLLIKDIIDDDQILLITRPRRFGKTLNLSMLNYFFNVNFDAKLSRSLFKGFKISQQSDRYLKHQNQYPVISFSFKDVKGSSFSKTYIGIAQLIKKIYSEHSYLLNSDTLAKQDARIYQTILDESATESALQHSLSNLTKYLRDYHGNRVVVLVDEYDTPIQSGYLHNYYQEIIEFFVIFFGAGLKDNKNVYKAVLTGILRVAKENLFSGLNNLIVYSMLNERYSQYFGFTENEVESLLKSLKRDSHLAEVKKWYNGYCIGSHTVYNPWSIANYAKEKVLKRYWINTSDNALIKKLVINSSLHFKSQLESLLEDKPLQKMIDTDIVFADLKENEGAIWDLLFMSGYLKSVSTEYIDRGTLCQVLIPNREVRSLYQQIIEQWLSDGKGIDWYNEFLESLLCGEMRTFTERLENILLQTISYHDIARQPEAFYQGLMIGLTASLNKNHYQIKSNRESGHGRYDIIIMPKDLRQLGIIIELKSVESDNNREKLMQSLKQEAQQALAQINNKNYDSELKQHGLTRWLKIGLAFSGKQFDCLHTIEESSEEN